MIIQIPTTQDLKGLQWQVMDATAMEFEATVPECLDTHEFPRHFLDE